MARGINKVILIGNLGNDPEVKYTQGGMAVATVSLATTSVWKDRDGNPQERTEWHRVKFFGKLGEIVGEYLRKGRQVYVEGSIRYDQYTDNEGVTRYTTDIIGDEMQMLGSGEGGGGQQQNQRSSQRRGGPQQSRPQGRPQQPAQRRPPAQRRAPDQQPANQPPLDDFVDDDIPF